MLPHEMKCRAILTFSLQVSFHAVHQDRLDHCGKLYAIIKPFTAFITESCAEENGTSKFISTRQRRSLASSNTFMRDIILILAKFYDVLARKMPSLHLYNAWQYQAQLQSREDIHLPATEPPSTATSPGLASHGASVAQAFDPLALRNIDND